MKKCRNLAVAGVWLLAWGSGIAVAAEPLTTTLTVNRLATINGEERLESAAVAKPGDTLRYTLDLHNSGLSAIRGVSATLPIPAGTEWVTDSADPAGIRASLDGKTYADVPLKRWMRQPDGSNREVSVPLSEYRFLRWPGREIPAQGDLKVSASVRVSALGSAPATAAH